MRPESIAIAITILKSRRLLDYAWPRDHLGWSQSDAISRGVERGHKQCRYGRDCPTFDGKAGREISEAKGECSSIREFLLSKSAGRRPPTNRSRESFR